MFETLRGGMKNKMKRKEKSLMPNKKFKLSKKQGLYAAAGAVLVGTLAAAAIT